MAELQSPIKAAWTKSNIVEQRPVLAEPCSSSEPFLSPQVLKELNNMVLSSFCSSDRPIKLKSTHFALCWSLFFFTPRYVKKPLSRLRPTRQPETKRLQLQMPHALFSFSTKRKLQQSRRELKGLAGITARFELFLNISARHSRSPLEDSF